MLCWKLGFKQGVIMIMIMVIMALMISWLKTQL